MSKVITSPVKRWPGTVMLADPLSYPQAIAVEDAIIAVQAMENPTQQRINFAWLPALMVCVEKWELEGITDPPDPLPATPARASAQLIVWIIREVSASFTEAEDIPNE